MSKLRKFVVTPHLYWRDFLLKRDPDLAKRIYHTLKTYAPALAATVAVPKAQKPTYVLAGHNQNIETLLKGRHYVQAEDLFDEILKHKNRFSESEGIIFYRLYALCATQCQNWSLAVQRWQLCLGLEGRDPSVETLYRLGECLGYTGNRTEAESFILKAITRTVPMTDDFLRLHDLYAIVAEQKKDWPTAIKRWQKRVDLKDENTAVSALCRLARCQNHAGQKTEAEKILYRAIAARSGAQSMSSPPPPPLDLQAPQALYPADLWTLQTLYAGLAESRKEWDVAAERWKMLVTLEASNPKPESYRRLIQALISAHKFSEAEDIIRKARDVFPDFKKIADTLKSPDHNILGRHGIPILPLGITLIIDINRYVIEKGAKIIVMLHPILGQLEGFPKNEMCLKTPPNGMQRPYMLEKSHGNKRKLGKATKNYISDIIKSVPKSYIGNTFKHENYSSDFVNVRDGFRHTTKQPDKYNYTVYCFGSSRYSIFSEDKHTIASFLQQKFNGNGQMVRVMNHSHEGGSLHVHKKNIMSLNINKDDIIILEFRRDIRDDNALKSMLYSNGIQCYDLKGDFMSPLKREGMFIDSAHVNHKGNKYIAEVIYNNVFAPKTILNSPVYKWAEGFLHALEAGTFFTPSGAKPEDEKDAFQARVDAAYMDVPVFDTGKIGSIVMNCNPITRGHMHLITLSSQIVHHLYVFVVEEDRSVFTFEDRIEMIRRATAHLNNVVVVPSGRFILSAETFPEYFEKDAKQDVSIDTSNDIGIFGQHIAKKFKISIRFIGEEPTDAVTRQYNQEMKNSLPRHGVQVIEIPRLESGDEAISASRVRRLLQDRHWDDIATICPQTTVDYLRDMEQQGRIT